MARLAELFAAARKLGTEHGHNAAGWYFDRTEPTREDYLKVLKGIEDVDPVIMDTFHGSPLSGEYADDMNPTRLFDEIEANEQQRIVAGDEICEAYEHGFASSYENTIVNHCEEMLKRNITFHIEVEVIRQDEHKLLAKIEKLLIDAGCSYEESSVSEEGEVIA